MKLLNAAFLVIVSFALTVAIYILGFVVSQADSANIISHYFIATAGYLCLVYASYKKKVSFALMLLLGIFLRLMLIYPFPNLSDDIYRFLWDGRLMHDGIHPLSFTPEQLIKQGVAVGQNSWYNQIYLQLNSPAYYTVYPPVSQLLFYISTLGESWSLETSARVMKLGLCLSELGLIVMIINLLEKLHMPKYLALTYFLCPLVIVELVGQMHYEGLMVLFLAAAISALYKSRNLLAGIMFGLSIGVKLLPLMFLPLVLHFLYRKGKVISFCAGVTGTLAILFLPFLWSLDLSNFLSSINLYFQKFEFNASIYYLLRGMGRWITGYNQIAVIGPLLSVLSLSGILWISLRKIEANIMTLIERMFYCFALYLFLTTTVHPWYLIMLLFLGLFSFKKWPIIWSGVVVLSYTTYDNPEFAQNMGLIFLEYVVVFLVLIWEYWQTKTIL